MISQKSDYLQPFIVLFNFDNQLLTVLNADGFDLFMSARSTANDVGRLINFGIS